jgi:hypothetical protein
VVKASASRTAAEALEEWERQSEENTLALEEHKQALEQKNLALEEQKRAIEEKSLALQEHKLARSLVGARAEAAEGEVTRLQADKGVRGFMTVCDSDCEN